MAILGKENLEAEAARRAKFRLNHVGTKLNEAELRAFEALVEKRRQTQGEFIRDLIAAEVRLDQEGETPSPEMVEIVAVRLLLMNMFKSLLVTGDLLPAEKWERRHFVSGLQPSCSPLGLLTWAYGPGCYVSGLRP
jgi:hypothetical protein